MKPAPLLRRTRAPRRLCAFFAFLFACSAPEEDAGFRGGLSTTSTTGFGSEVSDGGIAFIEEPFFDVGGGPGTTTGGGSGSGGGIEVELPPDACVPLELLDPRRSLIETNEAVLATFSLRNVFHRLAINSGMKSEPSSTHDLLIDTANDSGTAHLANMEHCDDELTDGVPSLNGYPVQCPRAEGGQIGNLDQWQLIALVNRIDLAPADGSHCGEQRMIFSSNAQDRMFIIFEAQIPNPDPACGVAACRPLAEFWEQQSAITDIEERTTRLRKAFLASWPELSAAGFPPFMRAQHMTFGTGQVRTNNFDQFPWDLKEFKLVEGPGGRLSVQRVPVASNLFGPLLDDGFAHPNGPMCRQAFIDALDGLLVDDVNLMALDVPEACLAGESLDEFDNLYDFQIALGSQGFRDAIQAELAALGSDLTIDEVAARAAFAGSCIGCHQQQVGADLGHGVIAPFSGGLGFVHVEEFFTESCGPGGGTCFAISPALQDVFLPFRHQVMLELLAECPDACALAPLAFDPTIATEAGGLPSATLGPAALRQIDRAARARRGAYTLGGRPLAAVH
ncbi:hypothetical protein [Paraliomyxa miuraensis]|uniref:hypothetical protein n=1 Tax=Paraliomyxa miuraensis TaxID=376150 RepID=UPI00224FB55E|nr:hypothetical protein [Paraliomyxa miuraensis]MCX4242875.1 hypothetical protein [Paraliomyxa miuraensis]